MENIYFFKKVGFQNGEENVYFFLIWFINSFF